MIYSGSLGERDISLGPKSTEIYLHDHGGDLWTHNLSSVMILGGKVYTCSVLLSWVYQCFAVVVALKLARHPILSHLRKYTRIQVNRGDIVIGTNIVHSQ